MSQLSQGDGTGNMSRKSELQLFVFLTAIVIPALAVAGIAAYGFFVWIFQMFAGPPGV